ncbi:MAG: DUF6941 family protein [Candidatus Dormibacteraceae bacterium]
MIILQAAFLADRGQANPDGSFMVWRGGITEVATSSFPAPINLTMILRMQADREDAETLHEFGMRIELDGREIGPWRQVPIALRVPEGEPRVYLNMINELRFIVQEAGAVTIEAMVDDRPLPPLHLRVRAAPQPPAV